MHGRNYGDITVAATTIEKLKNIKKLGYRLHVNDLGVQALTALIPYIQTKTAKKLL